MTTLVMGGTGFVGMSLVEALLESGEDVVVFDSHDLPPTGRVSLARRGGRLRVVRGDIRDRASVDAAFRMGRVDRLWHGAVITAGTEREGTDFQTIIDVNLKGTATVIEAARDHGVERIVYPSTVTVYGESLYTADRLEEATTPPFPTSLYGITKYASERMCLRFRDLWGLDLVCARLGSVFGPWERDTAVRDLLGPQFQLARLAVHGNEAILPARMPSRDWVYSRDVASGLMALLDAPNPRHSVYNIGSGRPTNEWSAKLPFFCHRLQELFPDFRYRTGSAEDTNIAFHDLEDRAALDVTRLTDEFGYAPRFGAETAYADYCAWLDRNRAFWQM